MRSPSTQDRCLQLLGRTQAYVGDNEEEQPLISPVSEYPCYGKPTSLNDLNSDLRLHSDVLQTVKKWMYRVVVVCAIALAFQRLVGTKTKPSSLRPRGLLAAEAQMYTCFAESLGSAASSSCRTALRNVQACLNGVVNGTLANEAEKGAAEAAQRAVDKLLDLGAGQVFLSGTCTNCGVLAYIRPGCDAYELYDTPQEAEQAATREFNVELLAMGSRSSDLAKASMESRFFVEGIAGWKEDSHDLYFQNVPAGLVGGTFFMLQPRHNPNTHLGLLFSHRAKLSIFTMPHRDGGFSNSLAHQGWKRELSGGPSLSVPGPQTQPVFQVPEEYYYNGNCRFAEEGSKAQLPLMGDHYTIEAWVKPDKNVFKGGITGWGHFEVLSGVNAFRFTEGGGLVNYWWNNDLSSEPIPFIGDGNYHHVAATYDGTMRRLYFDFDEVASAPAAGHSVNSKQNFCVGRAWGKDHEWYKGAMKGFAIWKEALSPSQMELASQTRSTLGHPMTVSLPMWSRYVHAGEVVLPPVHGGVVAGIVATPLWALQDDLDAVCNMNTTVGRCIARRGHEGGDHWQCHEWNSLNFDEDGTWCVDDCGQTRRCPGSPPVHRRHSTCGHVPSARISETIVAHRAKYCHGSGGRSLPDVAAATTEGYLSSLAQWGVTDGKESNLPVPETQCSVFPSSEIQPCTALPCLLEGACDVPERTARHTRRSERAQAAEDS